MVSERARAKRGWLTAISGLGILGVVGCGLVLLGRPYAGGGPNSGLDPLQRRVSAARARQLIQRAPIRFEANEGQTDSRVRYLSRGSGFRLFLTDGEAVMGLDSGTGRSAREAVVRMRAVRRMPPGSLVAEHNLPGRVNHFHGRDPQKWQRNVPTFNRVRDVQVYPGIDLVYHGRNGGLEYDFEVSPKADPSRIALSFLDRGGSEQLPIGLAGDGSLLVHTPLGDLRHNPPIAYQEAGSGRTQVAVSFDIRADGEVGFQLGEYDRARPLVIDPTLVYSSFLGGSAEDVGFGCDIDDGGFVYVTGRTKSANFPLANAGQTGLRGAMDIFVSKIDPATNGSGGLVYSTYLGGTKEEGSAFSDMGIAVDGSGAAYVTGSTTSTDFPVTAGAFDTTWEFFDDSFVTKLHPNGDSLVYSTYLGGGGWDYGHDIAVDALGRAHVSGGTRSDEFPTTNGAIQTVNKGGLEDVFVTVMNPTGTGLVYSTLVGDTGTDDAYSIAVDTNGIIYIAGSTDSASWPTTAGAFDRQLNSRDAFVMKIDRTLNGAAAILYSTFVGGTGTDDCWGLDIDGSGNAYITGVTTSDDFPTQGPIQSAKKGTWDAFVTKLSSNASSLVYSTYLGAFLGTRGFDIAVDVAGNAIVTGVTDDGVTNSPFVTKNQLPGMPLGGWEAFLVKYNAAGNDYVYATLLGGSGDENSTTLAIGPGAIAVDVSGTAYITGSTTSANWPVVGGAQAGLGGGTDAFLAIVSDSSGGGLLAPSNMRVVSATATQINLSWRDNSTVETEYQVERRVGGGPYLVVGVLGPNANSFVDTDVLTNTQYSYRTRCFAGATPSTYSNVATITSPPDPPGSPTDLNATPIAYNRVDLAWTQGSGNEQGFEVERKTGNGSFGLIGVVGPDIVAYVDNTVNPQTTYVYRVRAVNAGGPSGYTNTASATTPAAPPNTPTILSVTTQSDTRLTFRWRDESDGETGFTIQRKTGNNAFQDVGQAAADTGVFFDQGLSPNTTYTYRVRSVGEAGDSAHSGELDGLTYPQAPTGLVVTSQLSRGIVLGWSATGGGSGFKLERKAGSGSFQEVNAGLPAGTTAFTDSNLLPATAFQYRIRGYNAAGNGPFSNTVSTSTLPVLLGITLKPTSLKGGKTSKATVSIASVAPAGGAVVRLSSSVTTATTPATVIIPAGKTSAIATVKTKSVRRTTVAQIQASYGGSDLTAALTIKK